MKTEILLPTDKSIAAAAAEISSGGLVAFATETVYGLGADALNPEAVKRIFEVKGRPADNPLIVHLSDISQIEKVGFLTAKAQKAVEKFMPGALTIVLKKRECVPDIVSGGLSTVAVRIPANELAQKLIKAANTPIAAPSANTSTRPSPTEAAHVKSDLDGKIRYILDGGSCDIGLESTILDFSGDRVRLLRHGGIPLEILEEHLGEIEVYSPAGKTTEKPLCPGMKYRHYAPSCEVVLFDYSDILGAINEYKLCLGQGIKTEALLLNLTPQKIGDSGLLLKNEGFTVFDSVESYANRLFSAFRLAEKKGTQRIICQLAPEKGLGKSLNNRLKKAGGENER